MTSGRYSSLPSQEEADRLELQDAFPPDDDDDDNHNELAASSVLHAPSVPVTPGGYDFERDYDMPPPGSPPAPSEFARPNDYGNSNGLLPTSPVRAALAARSVWSAPRPSIFKRVAGAILPTHYAPVPTEDEGSTSSSTPTRRLVRGGGSENDGVFANVMAKPVPAQVVREENGSILLVPEDMQKDAPPSYATAQADAVPPYWETTVHAPSVPSAESGPDGSMLIEDLPSGPVWVFFVNLCISFFFQFVGFLLTFLLHTSHAAKYGSRAGLGLTLIQYGFYSRTAWTDDGGQGQDVVGVGGGGSNPPNDPFSDIPPSPSAEPGVIQDPADVQIIPGVSSRDWLSFLLMTLGWILFLSSTISFWRVKRWESSIRSTSTPANNSSSSSSSSTNPAAAPPGSRFLTRQDIEHELEMRRNLESVFGLSFDDMEHRELLAQDVSFANAPRVHVDENGHAIVIPGQQMLEEARLARDLRAAGLL